MLCLQIFLILVTFITSPVITEVHSHFNVNLFITNLTDKILHGEIMRPHSAELNHLTNKSEEIHTSTDERFTDQMKEVQNLFTDLRNETFQLLDEQKKESKLQLKDLQFIILELRKDIKFQFRDMVKNMQDLKKQQRQQQNTLTIVRNELHTRNNQKQPEKIPETEKENTEPKRHYPYNCAEAVPKGGSSGIYTIQVPVVNAAQSMVYCLVDPAGGDAWTIIQRRQDGTVDFYRNWAEYKAGFGNLYGEYFIGLDLLHTLTNLTNNELWIELRDFEDVTKYAKYSSFAIGNERDDYKLYSLGDYNGNVADSFKYHEGCKFSTNDRDNDNLDGSCADRKQGAWWYNKCQESNLNGRYLYGDYSRYLDSQGIVWGNWRGYYYSLKYTHMAIRPAKKASTMFQSVKTKNPKKVLLLSG